MIAPLTHQNRMTINLFPKPNITSGLSRVFSAAVVNRQFCNMLLEDPHVALKKGYLGEKFSLSREEEDLIVSIRANSLSDLARQVNRSLSNSY
jgi:hypothetical protein